MCIDDATSQYPTPYIPLDDMAVYYNLLLDDGTIYHNVMIFQFKLRVKNHSYYSDVCELLKGCYKTKNV